MKLLSLHFSLLILFCLTAFGGTPNVEKTFKEKYPDIEAPRWKAESNGLWEAHFEINGIKYRADFTTEGNWVET
ncbi:hypothetical protein OAK86_03585, partial [Akkermansiaceae bacterium]|nr:hypothetical protein [Akkermansiaceae bacterium]